MLANGGYDAENKSVDMKPSEAGYSNFAFQAACGGTASAIDARNGSLNAAIVPVRRRIRAKGGSFVDMYSRTRLLSGAWSITRRLKAARIRGDTDEARRMEALLGDMVSKAIFDEAEGAEP